MGETFVVIGGDAAGMSAASKAKRDNPDLEIIVFEKGDWVSYAACGMPYFIKGEIDTLDDLVQVTPEEFRTERNIDLRTNHEVIDIDPTAQIVTVDTPDETITQPYDQLLIGTGASAIIPPLDGIDLPGVFTIHDMDEADAINNFIKEHDPSQAAIVGGGYVGIEMAEALLEHDIGIELFEMLPTILQPFGDVVAERVQRVLETNDVAVHLETAVNGFEGDDTVTDVIAGADAEKHPAELVVVGVGVQPNVALAESAGIELGPTGAIATDKYGRTNYEHIFAAGDCAEATHTVTDEPAYVPLALTANRAGRAIGQTVTGTPTPVGEIAGTAIVKALDVGASRTGIIAEDEANDAGYDPISVTIDAPTRAHYYPGATELTVTLVADRVSGRILGASMVGKEGVKRIDTVATALHAGLTVSDLETLDLAYAPPFSPVWDPVLTAARVLAGKIDSP